MSKQKMAKWLAVKVLGFHLELFPGCETWHRKGEQICLEDEIDEFIYCPNGFFAVWDRCVSEEDLDCLLLYMINVDEEGVETWQCKLYDHEATGKDRYEAFYKAVYAHFREKN